MQKLSLLFGCMIFMLAHAEQPTQVYGNTQLSIKSTTTNCSDKANGIFQEKVMLEFSNKTNQAIEVTFNKSLWYNDQSLNLSKSENTHTVTLKPNETISGSCENKNKALFIFSKHLDFKGRELSKFTLDNISIKSLDNK